MTPVLFGSNTCYVLSGGSLTDRYNKREELEDAHPGAGLSMDMSDGVTYFQFLTGKSKPLDDNDAVRARAEKQGHVIDLNA